MILQAILVGLVAGYGRIEQSWFGQQMIARPIWLCTLVGLLLGDLKQGVIIGGTLELIWAGVVQIGAAPTEVVSGSVLASALGFLLPTYLGMGTMGVALTGLVCAYIYYQFKPRAEEDD